MINNSKSTISDADRVTSIQHDGRVCLTKLCEFILHNKRLPDDVDLQIIFTTIRDRLRDAEKEVRQHALRVLCEAIPITETIHLDRHMQIIVPELISNLESPALAVRTGAVDSLQTYLLYSKKYDQILDEVLNSSADNSTIVNTIPFFINLKTNNTQLSEILNFLLTTAQNQCINHEPSLKSLSRIKYLIGDTKFKKLLGEIKTTEYRKMCETLGLPTELNDMDETDKTAWSSVNEFVEDRVILETEITLESGPAITMQIHEESRSNSATGISESEEDSRQDVGVVRVLDDSESDYYEAARKTPRKVRFGGEVVKMRTPESDSSNPETERDSTTIHITVTDAVHIKTKRSLIPIRVTSLPSTPKKTIPAPKRLHMSTPNLSVPHNSKIPMRYKSTTNTNTSTKSTEKPLAITYTPGSQKETKQELAKTKVENKESATKTKKENSLQVVNPSKLQKRRGSRQEGTYSPIPVHNEIELFHNLTRSPSRSRKTSISEPTPSQKDTEENEKKFKETLTKELTNLSYDQNKQAKNNAKGKQEVNNWKTKEVAPIEVPKDNANKWTAKELTNKPQSHWLQKDQNDNWPTVSKEIVEADPQPTKENFNSFQVCPSNSNQGKDENMNKQLHQSLDFADLHGEEELWAKSEALDNLIFALEQPNTCSSLEPGPAALLFEALFACQHRDRLHNKADEALEIMIRELRSEVLDQCLGRLAPNLSKMGAPKGVRLALLVMNRCSAKRMQTEIIERGYGHRTREGSLQILMASARLRPSIEVEVQKAAQFSAVALRDRRRRVRHAALELLATLAQIQSNSEILDIVDKSTMGCLDHQQLMAVVRTRLSRRQLPAIETDGSVRYSSPRDQTELDWLAGNTLVQSSDSSSSSAASVNYWRHNTRHENGPVTDLIIRKEFEKDESVTSGNDPTQIWAVDSAAFSKLHKNQNANNKLNPTILRPVYILQPDSKVGSSGVRGHRRYDRGRSFSPPKHPQRVFNGSQETLSASAAHHSNPVNSSHKSYDGFRKSFSSEQLYHRDKPTQEHYSFSLSSRSSTTSTGSSTRSGIWQKDFRSGIPIPIASDTKLKLRTSGNHINGPIVARRTIFNGNQDPPVICRVPPQVVGGSPQLIPPKSSGSESSGYFTPPPDNQQAFVKLDTEDHMEPEMESQDCVDNYNNDNIQREYTVSSPDVSEINDYDQSEHVLGEQIEHKLKEELSISRQTLDEIECLENAEPIEFEKRNKSKSVVDLQTFLPDISNSGRKSVNSAPPLNDEIGLMRPTSVVQNFDDTPISPAKTPLPGALDYREEVLPASEPSTSKGSSSCRLNKRFARTQSRRSFRTPRTPAVEPVQLRPYSKPKEALQQALQQMDSNEWEVIIQGLNGLTRVIRYHPEQIESNIHTVCVNLAKHIRNLRSQVARSACHASTELFASCKRGLDVELEEVAAPLLQRTADTNKFLRADANASLDVMAEHLPLHRVVGVLTSRGCVHQNAVVRGASSRILTDIISRMGADKILQLPKETRDRIIFAAANALADGSLEARRHAKEMFAILLPHPNFQRHLFDAVPHNTIRHISKALNSIKPGTS